MLDPLLSVDWMGGLQEEEAHGEMIIGNIPDDDVVTKDDILISKQNIFILFSLTT